MVAVRLIVIAVLITAVASESFGRKQGVAVTLADTAESDQADQALRDSMSPADVAAFEKLMSGDKGAEKSRIDANTRKAMLKSTATMSAGDRTALLAAVMDMSAENTKAFITPMASMSAKELSAFVNEIKGMPEWSRKMIFDTTGSLSIDKQAAFWRQTRGMDLESRVARMESMASNPSMAVAEQNGTASGQASGGFHSLPVCTWSDEDASKYDYPFWTGTTAAAFERTVDALNEAGVMYLLIDGALLGAWRHGGPIPEDRDMDIVCPVWLNDIATCADNKVPTLRGYEKNDETKLELCGKTRASYVDESKAWLESKFPAATGFETRDFGGLSVNFAGVRVDWVVSILDQSILHDGPLCQCRFGNTHGICLEHTDRLLERFYGKGYMKPHRAQKSNKELWESHIGV